MHTVALHGDFALGRHLREDMGDPPWVDEYPDWQQDREATLRRLRQHDSVALLGYSAGGGWISELSSRLDNIACAVVYESPVWQQPQGSFPVLICWNDHSFGLWSERAKRLPRLRRRYNQALEAYRGWMARGRVLEHGRGSGRHLRRVDRPETWGLGHNWDHALTRQVEDFLSRARLGAGLFG